MKALILGLGAITLATGIVVPTMAEVGPRKANVLEMNFTCKETLTRKPTGTQTRTIEHRVSSLGNGLISLTTDADVHHTDYSKSNIPQKNEHTRQMKWSKPLEQILNTSHGCPKKEGNTLNRINFRYECSGRFSLIKVEASRELSGFLVIDETSLDYLSKTTTIHIPSRRRVVAWDKSIAEFIASTDACSSRSDTAAYEGAVRAANEKAYFRRHKREREERARLWSDLGELSRTSRIQRFMPEVYQTKNPHAWDRNFSPTEKEITPTGTAERSTATQAGQSQRAD